MTKIRLITLFSNFFLIKKLANVVKIEKKTSFKYKLNILTSDNQQKYKIKKKNPLFLPIIFKKILNPVLLVNINL